MKRRAVFFDRDGVLNETAVRDGVPRAPSTRSDLKLANGAREAVAIVRAAGFLAIGITNQPDVARGAASRDEVEAMNAVVARDLQLDGIYTCFHDDADGCDCRKPKPGLPLRAAAEHDVDLARSFFVGDRAKDVACGAAAGCTTIFLDFGYAETPRETGAHVVAGSLDEAVRRIALSRLRVKIFADGADLPGMVAASRDPLIAGFTTNPTLMRKAGVRNFEAFAREAIAVISDRPISFEVLADDFESMERQAHRIASWGENVYAKIPVTDTRGRSTAGLVRRLSTAGVKLNVTAVMTHDQAVSVGAALAGGPHAYVSVFAGRIADSGRDPVPAMRDALAALKPYSNAELIWASPRELLNIVQANEIGVHVITVTADLLAKLSSLGKDLDEFSLETVRMFARDAAAAGYELEET